MPPGQQKGNGVSWDSPCIIDVTMVPGFFQDRSSIVRCAH